MFLKNPRLCPIIVVQNLVLQCMNIVNRSNLFHYNHKLFEENILSAQYMRNYYPHSLIQSSLCLPSLHPYSPMHIIVYLLYAKRQRIVHEGHLAAYHYCFENLYGDSAGASHFTPLQYDNKQ